MESQTYQRFELPSQQKPLTIHGFEDEIFFWDGLFSGGTITFKEL